MNQDVMEVIHEARGRLATLKDLIHFHMAGEKRFSAEQELEKVSLSLNMIYKDCLQCDESDRREL